MRMRRQHSGQKAMRKSMCGQATSPTLVHWVCFQGQVPLTALSAEVFSLAHLAGVPDAPPGTPTQRAGHDCSWEGLLYAKSRC